MCRPEADAFLCSCMAWRAAERIEQEPGKPVITSKPYGRLLEGLVASNAANGCQPSQREWTPEGRSSPYGERPPR